MKSFRVSIFSSMAVIVMAGAVLSSCGHNAKDLYSEENVKEAKEAEVLAKHAEALAKYQNTFVSMFGQPDKNQCWDFTLANSSKTRGQSGETGGKALKDWPTESYNVYGYTWKYETGKTDFNESKVEYIYKKENGFAGLVAEIKAATPKDWAPTGTYKFRLEGADVNNPSDKYYTLGAYFNGQDNNFILRQIKTNGNTSGVTGDQHTDAINFDCVSGSNPVWFTVVTNKKTTPINSSAHTFDKFVEVQKEYNGKTYTFWGFKVENSYADIVLIVEKLDNVPTLKYAKRYFVEDLGASSSSDIDFNDIVFDVVEYTDGSQEVIVRALGGTLPVTINVCGKSWSKPEPVGSMINTGRDGEIDYGKVIDRFTISGWNPDNNSQISVKVEDKNDFSFITTFPENGEIPLMVAFSNAKTWKAETVSITPAWLSEEGEVEE